MLKIVSRLWWLLKKELSLKQSPIYLPFRPGLLNPVVDYFHADIRAENNSSAWLAITPAAPLTTTLEAAPQNSPWLGNLTALTLRLGGSYCLLLPLLRGNILRTTNVFPGYRYPGWLWFLSLPLWYWGWSTTPSCWKWDFRSPNFFWWLLMSGSHRGWNRYFRFRVWRPHLFWGLRRNFDVPPRRVNWGC